MFVNMKATYLTNFYNHFNAFVFGYFTTRNMVNSNRLIFDGLNFVENNLIPMELFVEDKTLVNKSIPMKFRQK